MRVFGHSINRAKAGGRPIEDGDYAIVDSTQWSPDDNIYVVSVIDGMCNIKKFIRDRGHNQVVLLSESSDQFPPIYIHPEETNYFVCGKVVGVIKAPPC